MDGQVISNRDDDDLVFKYETKYHVISEHREKAYSGFKKS